MTIRRDGAKMGFKLLAILSLLALSLLHVAPTFAVSIDQLPMYGGMDRTADPSLIAADDKLIAETTQRYGSREQASVAFVENGFSYYGRDDLVNAMRRFNQAWILNKENPEVYFGFAAVFHDQGRNCDAMKQFEKAASFGKYVKGMSPDAARVFALCAVGDKTLSTEAKLALFAKSDALYEEALESEIDKGYVHASRATALYWRENYSGAWSEVKLARANGGRLPDQFLRLLREKMPEPE